MASPENLRYTKTHEWVAVDGEIATIGITDFAQSELGDITYLELPEIGDGVSHDQPFGIVESVKAANDIFSPIDGEVVERNDEALSAPETVNESPYERAWLVRVRVNDPAQVNELMDATTYDEFSKAAAH